MSVFWNNDSVKKHSSVFCKINNSVVLHHYGTPLQNNAMNLGCISCEIISPSFISNIHSCQPIRNYVHTAYFTSSKVLVLICVIMLSSAKSPN